MRTTRPRLSRPTAATITRLAALLTAAASLLVLGLTPSRPRALPTDGRDAIVARAGYVKIRLQSGVQTLTGRFSGPATVLTSQGTLPTDPTASRDSPASFTATASAGEISLTLNGRPMVSSQPQILLAPAATYGTSAPPPNSVFQIPSGTYRGRLLLVARGGSIDVINQILIDDWLKGVLPAEIGGDAPIAAQQAQAVAGRSEAVHKLAHPPHASEAFDFCTGVHCQAYHGTKDETPASVAACDQTLGIVLTVPGTTGASGRPEVMDAVYHNVCGGVTALPSDVWSGDGEPGFIPVFDSPSSRGRQVSLATDAALEQFLTTPAPDTFCAANAGYPKYAQKYWRWTKTLNADELARRSGVGRVQSVTVTDRAASGRVRRLTLVGDRGTRNIDKELPIRNALDLWSGLFVVHVTPDSTGHVATATFIGGGNGHGVGLCQMGAWSAAARGANWQQILALYYPRAALEKIYRP